MTPVYDQSIEVTFPDRLTEVDFKFRVVSCRFPRAGRYSANLYAEAELLAQSEFEVLPQEG
jgi:hypothetical protein